MLYRRVVKEVFHPQQFCPPGQGVAGPAGNNAFIGDDLIDLGMMSRVGLPLAVANSVPEAKKLALYTSPRHGGNAAVRDIAEQILRARGQWDKVVQDNTDGTFTTVKNQIHIVKGL